MSPTAPDARTVSPQEQLASICTERWEMPPPWLALEEIETEAPAEPLNAEWDRAKFIAGLVRDWVN